MLEQGHQGGCQFVRALSFRYIFEKYGIPLPSKPEFREVYGRVLEADGKKILPLQHPAAVLHDISIKNVMEANYRAMQVLYASQVEKRDSAQRGR
jgi:hypothetical protein